MNLMSKKFWVWFLFFCLFGCTSSHIQHVKHNYGLALERINKNTPPSGPFSIIGVNYFFDGIIYNVHKNAKGCGLEPGDKIISLNGTEFPNMEEMLKYIQRQKIGGEITIRVIRDGYEKDIVAKTFDGRPLRNKLIRAYEAARDDRWNECINVADSLAIDCGGAYSELLFLKLFCINCKRKGSRSDQPDLREASLCYEAWRLRIQEASYHPGGVDQIKSGVLHDIKTLNRIGQCQYANDLKRLLDEASNRTETTQPKRREEIETVYTGTGFAISPNGLILTAYHVIKDSASIKVHLVSGFSAKAHVHQVAPSNDLAILKIDRSTPNYLSIAPLRSARTGDHIFTLGFPLQSFLGQEPKYTDGAVSSLSGIYGTASFMQISIPIQPGNSGGPVVNDQGQIVGIVTSSAAILPFLQTTGTLPQNVNWAIKADYLRPLVDLPPNLPDISSRTEAIERTKSALFFIEAIHKK